MDAEYEQLENVKTVPPQKVANMETGEEYILQSSPPEKADENFYKVFLKPFKESLAGIKSQKLKLILWLIEHMTLRNEVKYSYREIASKAGVSLQTVLTTIKSLEKNNFLCRSGKILIINPNVVFKGRYHKRAGVFAAYQEAKSYRQTLSDTARENLEEELKKTEKDIKEKTARQKELKELENIQKELRDLKYKQKELKERLHKAPKKAKRTGKTQKADAPKEPDPSAAPPPEAQEEKG